VNAPPFHQSGCANILESSYAAVSQATVRVFYMARFSWPSYYPAGCPPESAAQPGGVMYRVVSTDPPDEKDFKPYKLLFPQRRFTDECQACGLSVFGDMEDALRLRRRVGAFQDWLIARGSLGNGDGEILPTPTREAASHNTWWVPVEVAAGEKFQVIQGRREAEEGV
jgi:hypothetical protein